MGLKYTMFLWKGTSESLKRKLLKMDGMTDRTGEMMREREWFNSSSIHDLLKEGTPIEMEEMEKRGESEDYFSIWGMDLPGTGFVVGGYSNRRMFPEKYLTIFVLLVGGVGIEEFVLSKFHHGSNRGECNIIKPQPPYGAGWITKIVMTEEERENYEVFSVRADRETGYPITECHEFLDGPKLIIPWTFSVEFGVKELSP